MKLGKRHSGILAQGALFIGMAFVMLIEWWKSNQDGELTLGCFRYT
jgi:hypothetical protein